MYPRKSDSDSSAMRGTSSISSSSEIGAAATVVLEEMEEVDLAEEAEAVDLAVVDFEADDFDEVDLVLVDAFFSEYGWIQQAACHHHRPGCR